MLKFLLNTDLKKGLYSSGPEIEIVEVSEAHPYDEDDRPRIEPGVSLRDIEAMMRYLQNRFPHEGWRVVDGRVVCGWRETISKKGERVR